MGGLCGDVPQAGIWHRGCPRLPHGDRHLHAGIFHYPQHEPKALIGPCIPEPLTTYENYTFGQTGLALCFVDAVRCLRACADRLAAIVFVPVRSRDYFRASALDTPSAHA